MNRSIRFASRPDGERIAYAAVGNGPPVVLGPAAYSHLELLWDNAYSRERVEGLACEHTVIIFDRHGTGLSDRNRTDFTWRDDVLDIQAVMDAWGLERGPLIGVSSGGPAAIAFAAQHPERVSRLVLYAVMAKPSNYPIAETSRTIRQLASTNPGLAFRAFAEMLYPAATGEDIVQLSRVMVAATSPEIQPWLAEESINVDVTDIAAQLGVPTLILHRRNDQASDFEAGKDLASLIAGSRFVPLEGNVHLDMGPDWAHEILLFLREEHTRADRVDETGLSSRELEVLRLLAAGRSNPQIAEALVISPSTVAKHVTSIFAKTGAANRVEASAYAHRRHLV